MLDIGKQYVQLASYPHRLREDVRSQATSKRGPAL
jgi:hypothetical protein